MLVFASCPNGSCDAQDGSCLRKLDETRALNIGAGSWYGKRQTFAKGCLRQFSRSIDCLEFPWPRSPRIRLSEIAKIMSRKTAFMISCNSIWPSKTAMARPGKCFLANGAWPKRFLLRTWKFHLGR